MTSQSSLFSPQATLEKLTGEPSPRGLYSITTANPNRPTKSNFHALVIGINQYLHHSQLQGAVNDANAFKSYLLDDLLVPEEQITTLFDAEATRAGIIQAFQNLATDPTIQQNDPIIIYYAGHGAEIQPPPNRRDLAGSMVQCLVPQDAGTRDLGTTVVPPIPDFTISSLLNRIANAKGDNISVIFDSCHSASVTRINIGAARGSRSIPWQCFPPLPDDIDSDLIENPSISTRSSSSTQDEADIRAMQSHVLLAACSSKGLAYENLDTLPHHVVYKGYLKSGRQGANPYFALRSFILSAEKSSPQNPVCEGINVNRMLFNAMVSGADNSFIILEDKESGVYLRAGAIHGITPGCLFAIHADLVLGPTNPPLGNMVVDRVSPFESLLKWTDNTSNFALPKPSYGRQISAGDEHVLDLYITPEFEKMAPPDARWKIAFSGGEKDVILRLVEKDLAELIVDVNTAGWATFTFPRLQPAVENGLATLKHTVPADFQDVYRVISAAARFVWHLERFPERRLFQAGVRMEFYKLKESGKSEETGGVILETDGEDLNKGGAASVNVHSKDQYGFRIVNTTSRDLYAYLFYFSLTTLAINSRFLPVIGNGQVDAPLPKGGNLTLGYGSGGLQPFQFSLGPDELVDVGVFKLFLSTSPVDLSSMEQAIPSRIEPRRLVRENEAKHRFEALQVGVWDAITMELKLIPTPQDVVPERQPENQYVLLPPAQSKEERGTLEVGSSLPNQPLENQRVFPKVAGVTQGLIIDPDSGPRLSSRWVTTLLRPTSEVYNVHNAVITEEVKSSGALDAALAHLGFPLLNHMPNHPLLEDFLVSNDGLQKWTTRRVIAAKRDFSASPKDFLPDPSFIFEIEMALNHPKRWQRLKALKEVVESWWGYNNSIGENLVQFNPMIRHMHLGLQSGVIGYSSVATRIDSKAKWPRPPSSEELESDNPNNWTLVKVTRVASVLELLEDNLKHRIKQLYASLIFRSPCVGTHQLFGFDSTMYRGRRIQEVEVGFSDLRIESILVRYNDRVVAGPYGLSEIATRSDRFCMAKDEGITDILVWATDSQISSIQLLESGGQASPIYGATQGATQAPKLLSGNGSFLVGLSGGFDTSGITQIQAVWRGDTHMKEYRPMQTSHVGGHDGAIWSHLSFLDSQSNSHISSITARTPGTGVLGGLQAVYTSFATGFSISKETPAQGTANGPTVRWEVNEGEWITRVRGRHDGKTICQLQFMTNRLNSSPAFGQPAGDIVFDIKAPKSSEGADMVLHCMAGKSDECVNSILFIWAEPAQSGIIPVFASRLEHNMDPRATFYDLCAKSYNRVDRITSFEENSKAEIITRTTGVKPPLHALIIGINKYKINHNLAAAVSDALNFKKFLTVDLLVPEEQIKLILDEQARRSDIIKAFQDLAKANNGIKRNDAILIYYAGFGSQLDSPSDLVSNGSSVQCIVPQDVSEPDQIFPIPDFTIGALVRKIAQEKGDNITLIFDCGYFAGAFQDKIPPDVRVINKKYLPSFQAYPDRLVIQDALPSVDIADPFSLGLSLPEVDTHVLLAACGHQEAAFENRDSLGKYGYFTMALLEVLRSIDIDGLTYKSLIQRLPALKTNRPQNPVCEGKHVDRILFNAQVKYPDTSFIAIKPKQDGFYLEAGLAHGITPGSRYAVHTGDLFGPSDTVTGTVEVDQVDPFVAHLKGGNDLYLPPLCYGRQVAHGPDRALAIYFTAAFATVAEPSEVWSHVLCGGQGDILLRPTSPGLAQVVVSVYGENETTFTLTNQVSVKYGIKTLPLRGQLPIPPNASHVVPVLGALAKWNWYLSNAPTPRPFQKFVDLEFYKLQSIGELTDERNTTLAPEGENLIVGGEVNIVANAKDLYGIRVVNRSNVDLYAYLLLFSPTSLTIKHKSIPTISSSSQGILLPKSRSCTIGYGPRGQIPFTFSLDETQDTGATILRLFVSTHWTDIGGVEQESPFEGSTTLPNKDLKDLFGREAVWDVLGVNVAYSRWSETDETITKPYGGVTLIPSPGLTIIPNPGLTIIPSPGLTIIPVLGTDTWPTQKPPIIFPNSTPGDATLAPSPNGALFTGRSSSPQRVEAPTSAVHSLPWFRTPALTKELLSSIRCMRLRTFGSGKGPDGVGSSAGAAGYFEISVIGPDGFPKRSMTYRSHSVSKSLVWTDGTVFEENHMIWRYLKVGDCFEVSVCVEGKGYVCEAEMGNLIFW
ncbi:unnamed protein product [Rhizoctonia solani]|uniref:Uncharacterized protein n=1 Tax=Rhizoctonia solani TaxID=456999 RepID=A0A8H3BFB8_9AGAM|nr:unnamed protein product [Rhizoctonia solani]